MTGEQVKALAFTREKRRHQTSRSTLLKVDRKRARMRQRTLERKFVIAQRMLDGVSGCMTYSQYVEAHHNLD